MQNIHLISPQYQQGQIPTRGRVNFSRTNDELPESVFVSIAQNTGRVNASVNLEHMMLTSLSGNLSDILACKAMLKYLIPIFETQNADDDEDTWSPPTDIRAEMPSENSVYKGRNFDGYVLAINRLPYHQKMSLIIEAPMFVLKHCGILIDGQLKKFTTPQQLALTLLNFHLEEWNLKKQEAAREAMHLPRPQRNGAMNNLATVIYRADQRQVSWEFLDAVVDNAVIPSSSNARLMKTLFTLDDQVDDIVWHSAQVVANGLNLSCITKAETPYDQANHRAPGRQAYNIPDFGSWYDNGFDANGARLNDAQVYIMAVTNHQVIEERQRAMSWRLNN